LLWSVSFESVKIAHQKISSFSIIAWIFCGCGWVLCPTTNLTGVIKSVAKMVSLHARTLDCGHRRIEERKLVATSVLSKQVEIWPGIEQVFQIERHCVEKKSGRESLEVVYGVTSLSEERASASELLKLVRGHWRIENQSHWVRDVTFGEDLSQVRSGNIAQVMAALRNTAIGLMRVAGESNIAKACRNFAAQPWHTLALIGIHPKTE
jgi:predicted transposase YbfD/YdcC